MITMVPITEQEKALSYSKYFFQPMAEIPADKIAIWKGPAADPSLATPIEDRNLFLDEASMPLEMGFCVAPNGTGFVSNTTFMPNVTPEMIDWWFGWHSVTSDLRYKMWDPDDHYHARASNPDYVKDPNVPLAEKTWGMTHHILEDIGFGPDELFLNFKKPSDLGYDMSKIGKPGCGAMVCANGEGGLLAIMTHKAMETEGGILFKSHFWMGYKLMDDGSLVSVIPEGESVPEAAPRALFGHNIKEYANLAVILPQVYAEEKDNW